MVLEDKGQVSFSSRNVNVERITFESETVCDLSQTCLHEESKGILPLSSILQFNESVLVHCTTDPNNRHSGPQGDHLIPVPTPDL